MRQLEADHMAEEAQIAKTTSPANGTTTSAPTTPTGVNGNGQLPAAGAPAAADKPAPIGQGRELANGAKSMPASRRASGYGGTFGLEKLSLSVMEPGSGKTWTEDEDVDAEGAQSEHHHSTLSALDVGRTLMTDSVKYLGMNDDDPFPGIAKTESKVCHCLETLATWTNPSAPLCRFRRSGPRPPLPANPASSLRVASI
jgi:hypothetical protein